MGTLEQIHEVQKRLDETSDTIAASQAQYSVFDLKLKDASQLLGQLKKRTEQDTKYIWYSFWFFISVCAFIVLRRLKVFRMLYLAFLATWWSGAHIGDEGTHLHDTVRRNYRQHCAER